MKLSSKVYDVLKWVAIILLPALAKLIESSLNLWEIPYGSQIASQIIYVQLFLGAILAVDSIRYKSDQDKEKEEGETDA